MEDTNNMNVCGESIVEGPILHYPKDAMINACLKLHIEVFVLQSKKFEEIMEKNSKLKSNLVLDTFSSTHNSIIERRTLPDDLVSAGRKFDDVELSLQNLLDRDGKICRRNQVADFVILMTKMNARVRKLYSTFNFLTDPAVIS